MLIDFNEMKEMRIIGPYNGIGELSVKMYKDEQGNIIPCTIHSGSSIGMHKHETSDDINYVVSGHGKEEILKVGTCYICKKGSSHSIINTIRRMRI